MTEIYNISKGFRLCYSGAVFTECGDNEQWSVLTSDNKIQNELK